MPTCLHGYGDYSECRLLMKQLDSLGFPSEKTVTEICYNEWGVRVLHSLSSEEFVKPDCNMFSIYMLKI